MNIGVLYALQFQFLKGRYCLSFAVLFHFGRALVNGYAAMVI